MAGHLDPEQIRRVREAVDLAQLIGEYTEVQRAGRQFKACCPFHGERTPSFYIYPDDNSYHCFGCGAHGDAITFVREKENLDFRDALELLARRAGIELVWQQREGRQGLARDEKERLFQVMDWATRLYERVLWERDEGGPARAYLDGRGLDEAVCRRFRLGWAPGRDLLMAAARRERIDAGVLRRLDLATERGGTLSDRFYERVTFPIMDRLGRPLAFSARLLPEAERAAREAGRGVGKYVNSTDTPIFQKGSVVFNLHQARREVRTRGRLLVMEGPTDVMAADAAGRPECVAVLGTALTQEHARQLGNASGAAGRLVLLFDGDAAGQANALKAVTTCIAAAVHCRVAVMPAGADPAELLGQGPEGLERFEQTIQQARSDIVHLVRSLAPRPHALEAREQLEVVDRLIAALRPVADVDLREAWLDEAAQWLGLDGARLRRRLAGEGGSEMGRVPAPPRPRMDPREGLDQLQQLALRLMVRHPDSRAVALDELGVEPQDFPEPWSALVVAWLADPGGDVESAAMAVAGLEDGLREAVLDWQSGPDWADDAEPAVALAEAAEGLVARRAGRERRRLETDLLRAQEQGDAQAAAALFQELLALRRSE